MTTLNIPNTFANATVIDPVPMNANFAAVEAAVEASLALDGTVPLTGQLRALAGSAAAPGYAFSTDLDVGMFLKALNELGFTTNGALAFYLDVAKKGWFQGAVDVAGVLGVTGAATLASNATVGGTLGVTGVLSALSAIELGNASDTSLARSSAGNISVEGNLIYRAGGTDVPVADGGTGASTATGARTGLGAILTDAVFPGALIAIIEDQKASGTNGGTFTSGADQVRTLNTLVYNRNTAVALASNQFTLPAGSWEISWRAPAHRVDQHQTILRDITAGVDLARGSNSRSDNASASCVIDSVGTFRVSPVGSNVYELRHRCQTTFATQGFGALNSFGTEVYASVIIRAA